MLYTIISVPNHHSSNFSSLAQNCKSGYVSFFSQENKKMYYLYSGKSGLSLAPLWRRGADLDNYYLLHLLKELAIEGKIEVSVTFFKKIFYTLKIKQGGIVQNLEYHLFEGNIFIISQEKHERKYYNFNLSNYYKALPHIITSYEQMQLRKKKSLLSDIIDSKCVNEINQIRKIVTTTNQDKNYVFISNSFKSISFFSHIIASNNSLQNIIITGEEIKKDHISLKKHLIKEKIIKSILIITNLYQLDSKKIFQDDLWENNKYNFSWLNIQTNLSMERAEQIILDSKNYDIIIYRGHSYLKKGFIIWPCTNGEYCLKESVFTQYIHLACLNYQISGKDDLVQIPFLYGLLPLCYLLQDDYSSFLLVLFQNLNKEITFKRAIYESIHSISNRLFVLCENSKISASKHTY